MSLKSKKNKKYLFVCTGNTCRSPIGEYVAKEIAAKKGLEIEVGSRGTNTFGKGLFKLGCSEETCQLVMEKYPNSKIFTHIPSILTFKDLDYYNLILTMEENHRDNILREAGRYFPGLEKRVFSLKELGGKWGENISEILNVQDPTSAGHYYGGGGQCGFVNDDYPASLDEDDLGCIEGVGAFPLLPEGIKQQDDDKVTSSKKAPVKTPKKLYVNYEERDEIYRNCMEEIEYCVNNILSGNIHSWGEILERRKLRKEYLEKLRLENLKKRKTTPIGKIPVRKIPAKTTGIQTKSTKPAGQTPVRKVGAKTTKPTNQIPGTKGRIKGI